VTSFRSSLERFLSDNQKLPCLFSTSVDKAGTNRDESADGMDSSEIHTDNFINILVVANHNCENALCGVQQQAGRNAKLASPEFAVTLHPTIRSGLERVGIQRLYSHQEEGIHSLDRGKHVIVTTSTASGKSMIYRVPILSSCISDRHLYYEFIIVDDKHLYYRLILFSINLLTKLKSFLAHNLYVYTPYIYHIYVRVNFNRFPPLYVLRLHRKSTALLLFPTKALAQDQLVSLTEFIKAMIPSAANTIAGAASEGNSIVTACYDGDTSFQDRTHIRNLSNIILSNPGWSSYRIANIYESHTFI